MNNSPEKRVHINLVSEALHLARRRLLTGEKASAVDAVNQAANDIRTKIETPSSYRDNPEAFVLTKAYHTGQNALYYLEPPDSFYEKYEVNVALLTVPLTPVPDESIEKIKIFGDIEGNPYSVGAPIPYSLGNPQHRGVIPVFNTIEAIYNSIITNGLAVDPDFKFSDLDKHRGRSEEELQGLFPHIKTLPVTGNATLRQPPQRPSISQRPADVDKDTYEKASIVRHHRKYYPGLSSVLDRLKAETDDSD